MIRFNEQQQAILNAFPLTTEQRPLVVKARAGTGKTTVIEGGCRNNPNSRILLLCFNKPIAEAAKLRMPANVTCKTFAAFTWNAPMADGFRDSTYGRVYGSVRNERGVQRVNWYFQAKVYAKKFGVEVPIINAARATLDYFVSTADAFIGKFHVPYLLWAGKPKEEQEGFKEEVVTIARKLWRMKENPKDRLMPVTWNDITKLVQLEGDAKKFRGQFDYVIVDEAQDITACVLDLIKQMRCPIILVGDDFQRLYAFIHTINSLDELSTEPLFLTESHRFDQTIANAANDVLDLLQHQTPRLVGTGQPARISYDTPNERHTILSRTNTGLLANALQAIRQNKRIHVMGDLMGAMKQLESGYYLSIGQVDKVTHHSLSGFSTWDEIEALTEIDSDMKLLVNQIKMYGNQIPHLCSELEEAGEVPECKADVVLSTVHKCVHPDTLVETPNGLMRIRDIPNEGEIATPYGMTSRYHDWFVREESETLVVTTKRGYQIEITPDHGMTVWSDGEHVRKNASELAIGDWLRVRVGMVCDVRDNPKLPAFNDVLNVRAVVHRLPETMSESFAEFLGLMVADGTIYNRGFKLVKKDRDVADRFRDLVYELFGYEAKYYENLGNPGYDICSSHIATWLKRSFNGLCPNSKAIPEIILRSPLRIQAAFLKGLFEDGTVNIKGVHVDHIHFDSKFKQLARTVQTMLLRFEIISSINTRDAGDSSTITTLYIYGENMRTFMDRIGFVSGRKCRKLDDLPAFKQSLDCIPVTTKEIKSLRKFLSLSIYQNARSRKRISRRVASMIIDRAGQDEHVAFLIERMRWHYEKITSITASRSETMCVTVPFGNRFLQNGFDGWNSKGREWPHVKLDSDFSKLVYFSKNDRQYKVKKFEVYTMYVGVTRAQQVLYPNDTFQQCKGWKELLA